MKDVVPVLSSSEQQDGNVNVVKMVYIVKYLVLQLSYTINALFHSTCTKVSSVYM